jgi:hypothetical protein
MLCQECVTKREGPAVPDPRDPDEVVRPEPRAVTCQTCGYLAPRVATVI